MTHVIAEAGSNYNGSVSLAYELNEAAKAAGADSIKYQIIYPEGLYLLGDYEYGGYKIKDVLKVREENVLSDDEWWSIKRHADSIGLEFSASIFDERGLQLLLSMNPPYIKVSSSDLNNKLLLRKVANFNKLTLLSTGMSTIDEIDSSVDFLLSGGLHSSNLVILHCVSSYPTDTSDTNLRFITQLEKYGVQVGFSDHTTGISAAISAVTLGAVWIEKHFTTDRSLSGLDHRHSMNPQELENYVGEIRKIDTSLNHQGEKVGIKERATMTRARRGVYANRDLIEGQIISESDILVVRPPSAIPADSAPDLIGKKVCRPLLNGDPFPMSLLD